MKYNFKAPIEGDRKCNSDSTISNYSGSAEVLLQILLVNIKVNGRLDVKYVNNYVASLLARSDDIANLWNLEVINITDPCKRKKQEELEQAALHYFWKIVYINDDGRYEVSFPWVENKVDLPSNRDCAERRLRSTTSKLRREW